MKMVNYFTIIYNNDKRKLFSGIKTLPKCQLSQLRPWSRFGYFLWRLPRQNGVKRYKSPGILIWKSHISVKCVSWKSTVWILFPSTKQWQKNQSQLRPKCFLVVLKRTILNVSTKSCLKKFLLMNFSQGRITDSFTSFRFY